MKDVNTMFQIELNIFDYNKVGDDYLCLSCEREFFVIFNWHIKCVKCPNCGEVYEVSFI